jgi:hypothetical protein
MRSTGKEGNTASAAWKEACSALVLKRLPAAAPAGVAPSPAPKQKQRRIPVEEVLTVNRVLWTADDSKVGLWGCLRVRGCSVLGCAGMQRQPVLVDVCIGQEATCTSRLRRCHSRSFLGMPTLARRRIVSSAFEWSTQSSTQAFIA